MRMKVFLGIPTLLVHGVPSSCGFARMVSGSFLPPTTKPATRSKDDLFNHDHCRDSESSGFVRRNSAPNKILQNPVFDGNSFRAHVTNQQTTLSTFNSTPEYQLAYTSTMSDDDPFACFDSSDDESDAQEVGHDEQEPPPKEETIARDPGNGVLAIHAGTEVAMLHHVKTELAKNSNNNLQRAQTVLEIVDSYCLSRHWMMHVGPEKAGPLRKFINDALDQHATNHSNRSFTVIELGTYCGYSSIFIAKTILELCLEKAKDDFSFHIYSVEVVDKFAAVAKELIQLAHMEDYISVLLVKDPDVVAAAVRSGEEGEALSLSSELRKILPRPEIDFLFVDHDKSLYLPNLQELERNDMIRIGTHVAADNVVFAQIHDYREYMASLATKGIVTTRLEDALFVEYCQPELGQLESNKEGNTNEQNAATKDMMRDGIEFSVYLQDPQCE